MSKLVILIVIVVAALLCMIIPARLGFFKFGKTILGSVFRKPATLMYPVVPREWQERTRGAVAIDGPNCIGCGICANVCPTDAIEVDKAEGKWTIQRMQCVQCSACVDNCPKKCLTMENQYTEPDVIKVVDTFEIPAKAAAGGAASGGTDGDLTCADTCVFCGLCVKACPADAIKVDRKAKTWEVDTDACVKCGACIDKCPKKSLSFGSAAAAAPAEDGSLTCDMEACVFCGLCAKNCPADALEVDRKAKSWKVDEDACVKCGVCIDKCPKKCLGFGGETPAAPAKKSVAAVDEEKCVYCAACENECEAEAIKVDGTEWKLDEEKCMGCEACIDVCPADAISMKEA
ncbi:MAG: 4Fe-4S binding protein [Bacillota bacterium]|nr:4Fe-4S binding protein [Bacillota bacterium]